MVKREEQIKEDVSGRLRRAMERRRGMSIRGLEEEMREREADITSYGAVRNYVKGEKLPPLTFLEEAAEVLAVRPEWLILGSGEMTEPEETLAEEGIVHLLEEHPEASEWPERARELFVELLGSYVLQTPEHVELTETDIGREKWAELERDLFFLVSLPLRSWGFRELTDLSQRERFNYLLSILNGLLVAVEGVEAGDGIQDHTESLLPRLRQVAGEESELTAAEVGRAERLEEELSSRR